ncbi:MAG: DMT family transporter [Piscinibacter sp.]|nr:DMT family transporter [Piscinibacter sp.]
MNPGRPGQHPALGIGLVLVMTACFASMDSTVKYLGAFVPVLVILWSRYSVQAAAMGLWLVRARRRPGGAGFRSAHPRFQLARGLLLLSSSMFSFFALQHLPVAEFTAINMLTPVAVTLMAGWFLHERVSRLRWLLVIGGLVGALIVIRPGSGLFGWAVLLPLAGMFSYACFQVLTSKLSGLEDPFTTHFYTGLVGSLLLTAILLASSLDLGPTLRGTAPHQFGLLLLIGALGTSGHLMLVLAFRLAPTATLMPFMYAQLGMAVIVGWLVFRHAPDLWGWIGMAVIAGCGAASAWLNVREATQRQQALSAVSVDSVVD